METVTFRSMLALLVLFGACSLMPAIQANDFSYCTKILYPVSVHDVEISPQPVVNGRYTTFTMTCIAELVSVTSGEWNIQISNSSGIVVSDTYNLCEVAACPIIIGQQFVLSETKVYEWLEPDTYTLTMRIIEEGFGELVCIYTTFEIVDPANSYIRKVTSKSA